LDIDMNMTSDMVLIQATTPVNTTENLDHLPASLASALGCDRSLVQAVWSAPKNELYVYVELNDHPALGPQALTRFETTLQKVCPTLQAVRASRLEKMFDTPGASVGAAPVYHYVVETDPESGWLPEILKWYDVEHMPGLAAVPGSVRARRFFNHDHGPLSLACYDLTVESTLDSPPWLAIRYTDWSSRVRPHFTNTRRTMFRILGSGISAGVSTSP
jgi:hypothetical protein